MLGPRLGFFLFALAVLCLPQGLAAAEAAAQAPSQPVSALFYPGEAKLTVNEVLSPELLQDGSFGFVISLPATVSRGSFSATLEGKPAAGIYWQEEEDRSIRPLNMFSRGNLPNLPFEEQRGSLNPATEPSPERRALLEKLLPLRVAVTEKIGLVASIEARMRLLKDNTKVVDDEVWSPDEFAKMDELLSGILPELYVRYEQAQRELNNLRKLHDKALKELEEFDAANRFATAVIPFTGKPDARVKLVYSYNVPSSYSMDYRLMAYPEKKSLSIEQDVTLVQHSGFAWQNVEIFVSTTGPDRLLQPAPPTPWKITEYVSKPLASGIASGRRERMSGLGMSQMAEAPSAVNAADRGYSGAAGGYQPPVPVAEQKSTFRLWKIGKQAIASKTPVRIPVSADSYKAGYYYTLRPATYFRAFLTAELELDKPLELALGQARYFVDDMALGENSFSFNGNKGTIFFGTDPQVTGVMRSLKRSTGETGLISKEQTTDWSWEIVLNSTRAYPVEVRVEDPMPEADNDAFKLEVKSTPRPEQAVTSLNQGKVKVYRWKLTLKPAEAFTIKHEVKLSAPVDKKVEPGRGEI